jgi:hypothetical protein
MKKENLVKQVQMNFGQVKDRNVEIGDGSYSYTDTLKTIRMILHHQYVQPLEDDGTPKVFVPLASWMKEVILRNVDLDTKDIQVRSNTAPHGITQLVRAFIRRYNKENHMALIINKTADMLVSTGHVVIKQGKDGLEVVDTNDIFFLGNDGIQTSGLIIAKKLNYTQLIDKKKVWDNFKEIEDRAKELITDGKTPLITIYEQWGQYIENGKVKRGVIICSDAQNPGEPTTFHFQAEKKKYPFWETKMEDMDGRAYGRGTVEKVIGQQTLINESANLKRKADKLTIKGLFLYQTNNPELEQGVLNNIENGGVLTIGNQEAFTELNQRAKITEYAHTEESTTEWARRITGGSEVSSGEQLPSNMTATSAMLQNKSASTTFDLIREKMGILWSAVYTDYVIPQISKEIKKGDTVQLEANKEDDERTAETLAGQNGISKKEALEMIQKQGDTREVKIIADYFKNTKYIVDVYVTSEDFDKATLLASMNDAMLTYSQVAPGLVKVDKLIVDTFDLLGLDGQSYINANPNQGQGGGQQQEQAQQGGATGATPQQSGVAPSA